MEDLKYCPFCNSIRLCTIGEVEETGVDVKIEDKRYKKVERSYYAVCLRCKAKSGHYPTEDKVIEAWNRRGR